MAEQEINSLKEKLEAHERQFQSYKVECKQLESILEEENKKKQAEIKKLKEDAIMKEKKIKQIAALEAENATLKTQLNEAASKGGENENSLNEINKLKNEIQLLNKNVEILENKLQKKQQEGTALSVEKEKLIESSNKLESKIKSLILDLEKKQHSLQEAESEKQKLSKNLSIEKAKKNVIQKQQQKKSLIKKQESLPKENSFEKQKLKLEERLKKHEESIVKYEKQLKEYKTKCLNLSEENSLLQNKYANISASNKKSAIVMKQLEEEQEIFHPLKQNFYSDQSKLHLSCLLLTKAHYMSPFLEINDDKNIIKIYKSTRSGCFQKSLGSVKHKFDKISHQSTLIIEEIFQRVTQAEIDQHHSILIYGVKHTTKKYLMAEIASRFKEFLQEKMSNAKEISQALYIQKSVQEEKNYQIVGKDKDQVENVIEKVISLGEKKQKKANKSLKKNQSKPKIRYFNIKIDEFILQISTSSHTEISTRQKVTQSEILSNILYSKLPGVLQSSISQKYILLTLNPIVDLYDDCKNTLSLTLCKNAPVTPSQAKVETWHDWKNSPIKQELNDLAKKKLEGFERENEQTTIKIKRLEEECLFYRHKFEELEVRLKGLLNTHHDHTSYLKKSPVTLSYEKMLKFVHGVQLSKSNLNMSSPSNAIKFSMIEDDNESLEAI